MYIFKLTHTLVFITLITGCASFEKKSSTTVELQQIKVSNTRLNQRVNDAVTNVEQTYLKVKDENFATYAPNTWESVQKDLVSMRKLVNRFDPNDQGFFGGPSESTVLEGISEVNDGLIKAQKIKTQVTTFLSQPLADIEYLAPKIDNVWQRDFAIINQDLNHIINMIEDDYLVSRQEFERAKLQKKISVLEINIVTANYYSPLEEQFKLLNQQLIPLSYNNVSQSLQRLNTIIITSPRDTDLLTTTANLIKNGIQRAEHITTDVSWINGLDIKQREQIVLHYRATLEGLGTKFIGQDLSNLSYKAQVQTFELALTAKLAKFETTDAGTAYNKQRTLSDLDN
ncbi:hypothetical protein HWV01_13900 [Moritella sp. 5]|uniref:hypothetical protein n=1 Tax=Moritella sp. 5 TaxID=2746231 RepID=UPI001BAA75EE|nr:hypothetical protein [Moritella sp. 5]QUM81298.1 hypothetical protein HWV01_13900 [Moritella sp. 5]